MATDSTESELLDFSNIRNDLLILGRQAAVAHGTPRLMGFHPQFTDTIALQDKKHSLPDWSSSEHFAALTNSISPVRQRIGLADACHAPLIETRSAPDIGGIMSNSSSRSHGEPQRAATFHVFESLGGDTQIMPSQVYKDYQTSFMQPDGSLQNGINVEEQVTQIEATPARTGVVDFGLWSQSQVVHVHNLDDSVEDDESPGMPSSLQRDIYLKTPALAGQKRDRRGYTISPTTVGTSKSPGSALSNIFGNKPPKPIMTATQIFDNTQGMTSPADDVTRSDPVETRPSPNFLLGDTISPSIHAISSPTKDPRRTTVPREFYKPLEESQERRSALAHQKDGPASSSKVIFDDDTQSTCPGLGRKTGRGSRPQHRLDSSKHKPVGKFSDKANEVYDIRDDASESSAGEDSVYEYDEFGGEIVASQRTCVSREVANDEDDIMISDREDDAEVQGSPSPEPDLMEHKPDLPQRVDSSQEASSVTPAFAVVANSQPVETDTTTHPPHRLVDPSSLSSFVPGSQFQVGSSQWWPAHGALDAPMDLSKLSSLPKPPASNEPKELPEDNTVTNIPSSPPVPVAIPVTNGIVNGEGDLDVLTKDGVQNTLTSMTRATLGQPNTVRTDGGDHPMISASQTGLRVLNITSKPGLHENDSAKISIFDTAATHISASQTRSSASSSQRRRLVSESPRKVGTVRKLADIANDPSPPDSLGEVDISIGMDLMNEDDQTFLSMVKSPVKPKKGKVYGKRNAVRQNREALENTSRKAIAASEPPSVDTPVKHTTVGPTQAQATGAPKNVIPTDQESSPVKPARKRRRTRREIEDGQSGHIVTGSEVVTPNVDPPSRSTIPAADVVESHTSENAVLVENVDDMSGGVTGPETPSDYATDRVLAFFSGHLNAYYPATCSGVTTASGTIKYHVRFDDGTETALDRHHVAAFDLRLNDLVKVDLPEMRRDVYVVTGFEASGEQSQQALLPDINGHTHVQLKVKAAAGGRKSLPTPEPTAEEIHTIPTRCVKITPSMWPKYIPRVYVHRDAKSDSRSGTPAVSVTHPDTPSSRSRRQTVNSGHLPSAIPTPLRIVPTSSVFTQMAFAISYSSSASNAARDHLVAQIESAGGQVLNSGLHELFDITLTSATTRPSATDGAEPALRLKPEHAHLTFVALIADTHSRTQKYIQALSLSLPTLHHRWITDSLRASRPQEWTKYLLPAGESSYLGAVRSRSLVPHSPASRQIANRQRILRGGGVLLLADLKAKANSKNADRREVYAFLSLALGADKVRLVDGLVEARKCIDQGGWMWVHTSSEKVEGIAGLIAGDVRGRVQEVKGKAAAVAVGRKRKRVTGAGEGEAAGKLSVVLDGGVRVVGDEFVIQSLILGDLVED